MSQQFPDEMISVPAASMISHASGGVSVQQVPMRPSRPEFRIEIKAADGAMLLLLREEHGRLVIEGDESRWTEGAMKFLQHMRMWSGQEGLSWQDEVQKGAGQ